MRIKPLVGLSFGFETELDDVTCKPYLCACLVAE